MLSRIARKRGSSAAMSSRTSTVPWTNTARWPVQSSTSNCVRLYRRKISYFARCRVVEMQWVAGVMGIVQSTVGPDE
jgi:hypothetical protein